MSWDRVQSPVLQALMLRSWLLVRAGKLWHAASATQAPEHSGSSSAYELINCPSAQADCIFQKWQSHTSGPTCSSRTWPRRERRRPLPSPRVWAGLRDSFLCGKVAQGTPWNCHVRSEGCHSHGAIRMLGPQLPPRRTKPRPQAGTEGFWPKASAKVLGEHKLQAPGRE